MASLDALPQELHAQILSYLIRPLSCYPMQGRPLTMDLFKLIEVLPHNRSVLTLHPYFNLAATNRALRFAVEQFCEHLLRHHRHKQNLDFEIPDLRVPGLEESRDGKGKGRGKAGKSKAKKLPTTCYRKLWVMKATYQRCIWCGKASQRRGNFDMFMWVCAKCDKEVYGATTVSLDFGGQYQTGLFAQASYFGKPYAEVLLASGQPKLSYAMANLCDEWEEPHDLGRWFDNSTNDDSFDKQSKTAVQTYHKLKPIHYLAPRAVFPPEEGFPPVNKLTIGIHALSGGVDATLMPKDEVIALDKYVKEHDSDGSKTKAKLKAQGKLGENHPAIAEAKRWNERDMAACKDYVIRKGLVRRNKIRDLEIRSTTTPFTRNPSPGEIWPIESSWPNLAVVVPGAQRKEREVFSGSSNIQSLEPTTGYSSQHPAVVTTNTQRKKRVIDSSSGSSSSGSDSDDGPVDIDQTEWAAKSAERMQARSRRMESNRVLKEMREAREAAEARKAASASADAVGNTFEQRSVLDWSDGSDEDE
jgi:ribosomal protein L37AE/L43A